MFAPSANTQAVLLLTSPLLQEGGRAASKEPVLSAAEYAQLAACLQQERAAGQLYFGIVQGGKYPELREKCAKEIVSMGFDGYALALEFLRDEINKKAQ